MPDDPALSSIGIPRELFDQLLQTQDLSELKAILCVLRLSYTSSGRPVPSADLLAPDVARTIAGPHNPEGAQQRTHRAVDRAVTNGSLLRITIGMPAERESYMMPATAEARLRVERLRAGDPGTAIEMGISSDAQVSVYRPNVFAFYEQHLGPLTPLVADQLRDAERSYPRLWIEEAIVAAADSNSRSWRYIETILTRWEETGVPDR
jgi:DNA replication protein